MADSLTEREQGKRERLVDGAREVIHRQGVENTTIADIALAAKVPVGNVYYYFKTKDELVAAAIHGHAQDVHAVLESLERHHTPQARLKALVRELMSQRELISAYGCPLGSLCSELDKRTNGLDRACAELLRLPVDWRNRGQRFVCQKAISPPSGVVTTLRHPAGPSRGASITHAPSDTARAVASATDSTSTYGS